MFRLCIPMHERRRSHARRGSLSSYALSIALVSLLCSLMSANALAQPKPAKHGHDGGIPDVVLAVCHLNFDCYKDTIVGLADEQFHYLPTEIHWGAAPANADTACVSETPKKKRERITTIKYPNWKRITGSVSFERLNADSLTDIVLYLWGDENGNGARQDSLRALCIFGQVSLDAVKQINLASIAAFQSHPYFAMELLPGTDFRDEKKRDLSGTPRYEVKRFVLDVRKKNDTAHGPVAPPLASVANAEAPAEVRVYPNPSAAETQIEAERLPPGEYTIEVVAVNGTVALRQDVIVSASQSLLRSLDVRELPSGYYVLRLHGRNGPETARAPGGNAAPQGAFQWTGTYPIIVTR